MILGSARYDGGLMGTSQNGSNGTGDRANLDTEYQQLSAEITRIAAQTKFNGTAIVGAMPLTSAR